MQPLSSCRMHLLALLIICTLFLPSCKPTTEAGDTIVNISDPGSQAITFTLQGWNSFEAKRYPEAVTHFRQAVQTNDQFGDAYNGLGWTYARMDSLQLALHYFDIALGQQANFLDAYAGRSFVSLALGDYRGAILCVSAVEETGSKFYSFRHDVKISMDDLLLVKAQSYFMLSNYPAAQALIDRLDPDNALDPTSASYIEDLAFEIESLTGRL